MLSLHCMTPTRLVREDSDDTTTQSRSWTVGLQSPVKPTNQVQILKLVLGVERAAYFSLGCASLR